MFTVANNVESLIVDDPLSSSSTTLNVETGDGSLFPDSFPFVITVWDESTYSDPTDDPNMEIMYVTSKSSDTLTVTRGQESTSGVEHSNGSRVAMLFTAGIINDSSDGIIQKISDDITTHSLISDAHHTKTTSLSDITDSGSLAEKNTIVNTDIDSETSTNGDALISNGDGTVSWTSPSYRTDEEIEDVVGAFVVGGTNVTVVYDDTANTLTLSSSDTQNTIDNTATSGNTDHSISSDWAYIHENDVDAHHSRYTGAEAVSAVNAETSLSVNITGDADTVDGFHASDLGSDVSDDGVQVVAKATDINFGNFLSVVDDGDGTVTVNADGGTDADTVDGAHLSDIQSEIDSDISTHTSDSDAHHAKYTDSEAITAINGDTNHATNASHNYFSGSHTDLINVGATDHHTNVNDPTPDEKAALSGANTPSSTNPFATMDDVGTLQSMMPVVMPVGIKWDTASSSPSLTHIDINGNTINPDTSFFDNHAIWGNIWRCVVDPATGEVTYGSNPRGDGLDLTGASGNVMVSIPRFHAKFYADDRYRMYWLSPTQLAGFEEFPSHVQRGGVSKDRIFVSAYEASGILDTTFKLQSATGKQPVTGGVAYPDLPNSGRFTIDDAELYANNIGSGYGCMNIWTMAAIRLLFYTEMGSLDSQTALGRGVVDLDAGTGFAGLNTGADSADTNIGTNGTGTGTGSNGYTPIVYRGIENVWGNAWTFCIGYNAVDSEYRITPRDGTGVLAGDLAAGEYEASTVAPITTDGYQSDVETENLLKYLLIGSETAGSSSTYLCDYFYAHDAGEQNVVLSGGFWIDGSSAGVGSLSSNNGSSNSYRYIGARFEFIP